MYYKSFIAVCLLLVFGACAQKKNAMEMSEKETAQMEQEIDLNKIAQEVLQDENVQVTWNEDKTYALWTTAYHKDFNNNQAERFCVLDSKGQLVVKERRVKGSVKWKDNQSLELIKTRGVIRKNDPTDMGYSVEVIVIPTQP